MDVEGSVVSPQWKDVFLFTEVYVGAQVLGSFLGVIPLSHLAEGQHVHIPSTSISTYVPVWFQVVSSTWYFLIPANIFCLCSLTLST